MEHHHNPFYNPFRLNEEQLLTVKAVRMETDCGYKIARQALEKCEWNFGLAVDLGLVQRLRFDIAQKQNLAEWKEILEKDGLRLVQGWGE